LAQYLQYAFFGIFMINLLNLSLPLGDRALTVFAETKYKSSIIGNSGYTQPRFNTDNWAVYQALEEAERNNNFIDRDECVNDWYWSQKSTILPLLTNSSTYTSYGTVWGLAEKHELSTRNYNPCFILIQDFKTNDRFKAELEKRELELQNYEQIGNYRDSHGLDLTLFKKIIKD